VIASFSKIVVTNPVAGVGYRPSKLSIGGVARPHYQRKSYRVSGRGVEAARAESWNGRSNHSARNASKGEIELARRAGIKDAANADNPSATTAINVTAGLYGFKP